MAAGLTASLAPKVLGGAVASSARSGPMATQAALSLGWFGLAGLLLLAAPLLGVINAPACLGSASDPRLLALTHAWVLGFLGSATFGGIYQLLSVAVGEELAWPRLAWIHGALHAVGVPVMVAAFLRGNFSWVAAGGSLVAVGALLASLNMAVTIGRARTKDAVAWAFGFSAFWLSATVIAGFLLAVNRAHPVLPGNSETWLKVHAHLGVVGFYLTLLQGAAFRLLPMFTLGDVKNWMRVASGLGHTQAGLIGLIFAIAEDIPVARIVFGATIAMGLAMSASEAWSVIRSRRKRVIDTGVRAFLSGAGALAVAIVLGLMLAAWPDAGDGFSVSGAVAYGFVAIVGALALAVGGMMLKIVPFLVWMRRYGPVIGKEPVPLASKLPSPLLERAWFELHLLGLVLVLLGLARSEAPWLYAGWATIVAASVASLLNHGRIAGHLWRKNRTLGGNAV